MKLYRTLMALTALVSMSLLSGCAGVMDFSPDGKKLVVAWKEGLMTVNADGTGLKMVPNAKHAESPSWSPDGSRIVFSRKDNDHQNLYSHDLILRKTTLLFRDAGSPYAWKEDGTRLWVASTNINGNQEIVRLNIPNGEVIERVALPEIRFRAGFDMRMISIPATESVAFVGERTQDEADLYLVEAGKVRPVTSTHDIVGAGLGIDGRSLVWLRGLGANRGRSVKLYTRSLDTGAVISFPLPPSTAGSQVRPGYRFAGIGYAIFSPNGRQLAVLNLYEAPGAAKGPKRSYMECASIPVSGSAWRVVQRGRADEQGGEILIPMWSSDGTKLAVMAAGEHRAAIGVFSGGGKGRVILSGKG
jgi:hypothetical protein